MRSSTLLFLIVSVITTLLASGSDVELAQKRQLYAEDPNESVHPPPHHPKHKPSSGSGGSSSSGGSSGGSSSGSSSGSSGSSSSSSGGSGGSSSVSGSGSGGGASAVSGASSLNAVTDGRKGTFVLLGVAAVAGVAIAAATVPKRRVETPDHPLKGSLNKRINLFSNLASHAADPTARPPRRGEDGAYVNADAAIV